MEERVRTVVKAEDVADEVRFESSVAGGVTEWSNGMEYKGTDSNECPVTAAQVEEIIRAALAGLRVYVLESDITDAQNAVRAVVEKTVF